MSNVLFADEKHTHNLPTDCRKVVAGVGHEMVETQGVGVGHILVPDFAMVAVVQGQLK